MKYTIEQVRKAFKAIGYRTRMHKYADFIYLSVTDSNGDKIFSGDFFSKEHLEKHAEAFALKKEFKGKVFDGLFRVVV